MNCRKVGRYVTNIKVFCVPLSAVCLKLMINLGFCESFSRTRTRPKLFITAAKIPRAQIYSSLQRRFSTRQTETLFLHLEHRKSSLCYYLVHLSAATVKITQPCITSTNRLEAGRDREWKCENISVSTTFHDWGQLSTSSPHPHTSWPKHVKMLSTMIIKMCRFNCIHFGALKWTRTNYNNICAQN